MPDHPEPNVAESDRDECFSIIRNPFAEKDTGFHYDDYDLRNRTKEAEENDPYLQYEKEEKAKDQKVEGKIKEERKFDEGFEEDEELGEDLGATLHKDEEKEVDEAAEAAEAESLADFVVDDAG